MPSSFLILLGESGWLFIWNNVFLRESTRKEKTMEKKTYTRPQMAAERFEPQEYCNPCTNPPVTSLAGWSIARAGQYIDLNNDGDYQTGERFYSNGQANGQAAYYLGIPDQVTNGRVKIGYLTLSNGTQNTHTMNPGEPYANHTSSGNSYKYVSLGTYNIVIVDNCAYVRNNS